MSDLTAKDAEEASDFVRGYIAAFGHLHTQEWMNDKRQLSLRLTAYARRSD